jgi:hypothetical protein
MRLGCCWYESVHIRIATGVDARSPEVRRLTRAPSACDFERLGGWTLDGEPLYRI